MDFEEVVYAKLEEQGKRAIFEDGANVIILGLYAPDRGLLDENQ